MFWYTHFYAAVCLYGSAAVGKILLIHTLARNLYYGGVSGVDLSERFFDVSLLLWCCVLLFLTQRGLCSAYVPMMMVVFPLASKLLLTKHFRARATDTRAARSGRTGERSDSVMDNSLDYSGMQHITPHIPQTTTASHTCSARREEQRAYLRLPCSCRSSPGQNELVSFLLPESLQKLRCRSGSYSRQATEWGTLKDLRAKGDEVRVIFIMNQEMILMTS
ncbi:hypothetical protein cypCar_00045593 [Cyprinus carpio]|nr:hypothetical protein cypCar_00045593 [Cyprinus carpio]